VLKIGKGLGGAFDGTLDNVRLYHEVLSEKEIQGEMGY
jgi:hypothetical protein